MKETLDKRQRLYDSIRFVKDDYTKRVLYSQFIDTYYREAFEAIIFEYDNNRINRIKRNLAED